MKEFVIGKMPHAEAAKFHRALHGKTFMKFNVDRTVMDADGTSVTLRTDSIGTDKEILTFALYAYSAETTG